MKDKTNAFGCFVSILAGCDELLPIKKWPNAGIVRGPVRNVAWRVIDAKYFGVPQQRKRLYVVAGGRSYKPENVLFERHEGTPLGKYEHGPLTFEKGGKHFEVFRSYTDCLYSAYGTKWNGNAAAYNGSMYVCENGRLRRLTPLESERLMGFPDNYTNVPFSRNTTRFQGTGNSWAVPVIRWIGSRLYGEMETENFTIGNALELLPCVHHVNNAEIFLFDGDLMPIGNGERINVSSIPEKVIKSSIQDVIDTNAAEELFISPVGCKGILRRAIERGVKMNERLKEIMENIAAQMSEDEIEKISRIQPRGKYTLAVENGDIPVPQRKRRGRKANVQQLELL